MFKIMCFLSWGFSFFTSVNPLVDTEVGVKWDYMNQMLASCSRDELEREGGRGRNRPPVRSTTGPTARRL